MLVFDQLKKDDPQLRFLAMTVLGGLFVLLAGLWWVQVVSTNYYREKLEIQSQRTVRIPAVRGRILDREGRPLAENHPSYNVVLYLDAMSQEYQSSFATVSNQVRQYLNQQAAQKRKELGRDLTPQERRPYTLTAALRNQLSRQTRYEVTSNLVAGLGARLGVPLVLPEKEFEYHYTNARALPMPLLANLSPAQVAMFEEQSLHTPAMDLEVQSVRSYPNGSAAAHLLGYLTHDNTSTDEEARKKYSYRLEDYAGKAGIEKLYDAELRGTAGSKSVLVNNYGYRQGETLWVPAEPGQDVQLTIDLDIQKAAESALQKPNMRGAVVVMDARNGDILAMSSAPAFNPNHFVIHNDPNWDEAAWNDALLSPQKNRAMQENYRPGSTFKIVVGLAALEQGTLDPSEMFRSDHIDPANGKAYWPVGNRKVDDTAPPGLYDLNRAVALSCNSYFIYNGLKPGVLGRIITIGKTLHLGERTALMPRQETPGRLPNEKRVASRWTDGDTANLCIGQGEIDVTPLQIAIMTTAVASWGKVYWPRVVSQVASSDGSGNIDTLPGGRLRDTLRVNRRSLELMRRGMLEDVESAEGSGRETYMPGFRIAGKTGTAEVQRGTHIDKSAKDTWFVSFAPYDNPRYVVVTFVEGGASGKITCVPIARQIYEAILDKEKRTATRNGTLAEIHN